MASKITNTEFIKDENGEIVEVTRGKLILRQFQNIFPEIGQLGWNSVSKYFIWTREHQNFCLKYPEYRVTEAVVPMIISKEKYEIGDDVFNPATGGGIIENTSEIIKGTGVVKVIALPRNLGSKFLEEIVNHRLIDFDEVFVRVETKSDSPSEKLEDSVISSKYKTPFLSPTYNFIEYFIGERDIATAYAAWCWGKQIPTEVSEIKDFFNRFLKETGRTK